MIDINLPDGAVLCDMSLSSQENQSMFYDDHFLLTLDDVVFATTYQKFLPMLDTVGENNLPVYSWDNIVTHRWDVPYEVGYCLGDESVCDWPATETQGVMSVSLSDRKVEEIMALDIERNQHQLQFVTVGDNDYTDCIHSDFEFDAELTYAVPAVMVSP